jgi:cytochrome c biogenesis protein CcdA
MQLGQIGLAYMAGLLALLSPCSLPMLPSYIAYYLNNIKGYKLLKSAQFSFFTLIGFLGVYFIIGIFPSLLIKNIFDTFIHYELLVGLLLISLGILSIKSNLFDKIPSFHFSPPKSLQAYSFLFYGVGYAFASLSCSLPIFVLIVLQSYSISIFENMLLFIFYGLGAGTILFPLTIAIQFSNNLLYNKIMEIMPFVKKINFLILELSGLYFLIHYFIYKI